MNIKPSFPMIDASGKVPDKGAWQRIIWRKVEKMVFSRIKFFAKKLYPRKVAKTHLGLAQLK